MLENTIYVDVVGEPFLSRAQAHKAKYEAAMSQWQEFVGNYGALGVAPGCNGLIFENNAPDEDWTRIVARSGFSRPKPGTLPYYQMQMLPGIPKAWDVFGDQLLYEIPFDVAGQERVFPVCELWDGPQLIWDDEVILALIPDPKSSAEQIMLRFPNAKILNCAETWSIPEGLVKTDINARHAQLSAHAGIHQ